LVNYTAVLFSAGLDSAVLLADALARAGSDMVVRALYVSVGFTWEAEERAMAARLFAKPPFAGRIAAPVLLRFDMLDVFPPTHWAVRGEPPAFDTPDEDVFLDGRNVILLSKAAVYVARARGVGQGAQGSGRIALLLGSLGCNPFPDATPEFRRTMAEALSLGLAVPLTVEAPFSGMHKSDVIRRGVELGVPFELTLSCMQPKDGRHCGRCSKCRERRDAFREAAVADPTPYREQPRR
jgi:7-cyano-7-deazaguanine synthase